MRKIVLASNSPRRKQILKEAGYSFVVDGSNFEEDMTLKLKPADLVKFLSQEKAKDVASRHRDAIVIGADTLVSFNNKVLGKPKTIQKARQMLQNLSGKPHSVFTGYTIIDSKTGKTLSEAAETKIFFKRLSDKEIDDYIKEEKPFDRAGSYAIESLGMRLVDKLEGDFSNVVGLPVNRVVESIKKFI